jgi:hypothetical protein
MLASDFFHADSAVTLTRVYVLFAFEAGSRYVHIPSRPANRGGARTVQQARNLLMYHGDQAGQFRILIRDRPGSSPALSTRCSPAPGAGFSRCARS